MRHPFLLELSTLPLAHRTRCLPSGDPEPAHTHFRNGYTVPPSQFWAVREPGEGPPTDTAPSASVLRFCDLRDPGQTVSGLQGWLLVLANHLSGEFSPHR